MNPRCVENSKIDNDDMMYGTKECPICECPEERICNRYITHDVDHIMPVHTKIVNHHIYRHRYIPCYTCEECNTCENVYEPMCKKF